MPIIRCRKSSIFLAGLITLMPLLAAGQKKIALPKTPVQARADQLEYDRENELLFLRGNVQIDQPPWRVRASELEIELKTNLARGRNGVRISRLKDGQEQEVLAADRAELELDTQTGILVNARLTMPTETGEVFIKGERLERVSENLFLFNAGSFTTCQCPEGRKPDWEVKAKTINADTQGSAKMRSAQIRILGQTILYLPYLEYPITDQRKSGLLPPELGYSSRYGYKTGLPFYLVMGPSADLTITPYWLSERGFLTGAEFRHNLGDISKGSLEGFAIDDQKDHAWRWSGKYQGESRWSSGWLRENINWISDNEYIRDFDPEMGGDDRWRKEQDSSIILSQNLPGSNLSAEFTRFDDLAGYELRESDELPPDSDQTQLWLLPQIRNQIFNRRIAGPLGFDMTSNFDYFYRQDQSLGRGAELDLTPRFTFTPHLPPGIKALAFAGYQGSVLYPEPAFSESVSYLTNPVAGTRLGLALEKIFDPASPGPARYRHLFEPEIIIRYKGESDEPEDRFFPQIYHPEERGQVGLRLSNLLFRKELEPNSEAKLVSELELNQFYDWVEGQFYDFEIKGSVQSPEQYGLNLNAYYNFDENQLHRLHTQVWVQDSRADRFWVGYLLARGEVKSSWYSYPQDSDENWTGGATIKLTRNYESGYQIAYSQKYKTVVSQTLRMKYLARQNCWAVNFAVSQRLNPEDPAAEPVYSTSLNFQLLGVTPLSLSTE